MEREPRLTNISTEYYGELVFKHQSTHLAENLFLSFVHPLLICPQARPK